MVSHDSAELLGAVEQFVGLGEGLLLAEERPLLEQRGDVLVLWRCKHVQCDLRDRHTILLTRVGRSPAAVARTAAQNRRGILLVSSALVT